MIKLYLPLLSLLISLSSCNRDDDVVSPSNNSNNTSTIGNILPIQVDIVYSNGDAETIKYTYEDNTLVKAKHSDGTYYDYIYENNKLTNINYFSLPNPPFLESYTYDAQGRITTITTRIINLPSNVYTLSYNNENSVITKSNDSDTDLEVLTISNGNLISYEVQGHLIETYTYDDKNTPFKNINNREIFLTIDSENNDAISFTVNNKLTENILDTDTSTNKTNSYTYTYTDSGFPRTVQENFEGDVTTYTYTYNND